MWLEPGTVKSLVCRYNEQHRQGLQSYSVSAAAFATGGLCLMHHWGLGWGTGNTGDDYAYMVLAHRSIALRCAFSKCDVKGTC